MERRLVREGFRTLNLGYPSTRHSVEQLAQRLESELARRTTPQDGPVHFVTHSMGGIVVRALAARSSAPPIGRVVMLAPPNQGSEIVDWCTRIPFLRAAMATASRQLRTGATGLPARLGPATFETGVIAGTSRGLALFQKAVPSPSDGTVSVASTRLEGMSDFFTVARVHTFIQNDGTVLDQTVRFLRTGRFDVPPRR